MNSVRHSTQEHSENGLLHHLLYAPSLLNLMSKNIFKNIFVLVHTFVLDLLSFSSLRPFGGGSNLVVRPPLLFLTSLLFFSFSLSEFPFSFYQDVSVLLIQILNFLVPSLCFLLHLTYICLSDPLHHQIEIQHKAFDFFYIF